MPDPLPCGFGFPRVAASCDYLTPARFEDVLDVEVVALRIGTKSVTYGFEFRKGGETVARGRVTSVCCWVSPGHGIEAVEIPEAIRVKLLA